MSKKQPPKKKLHLNLEALWKKLNVLLPKEVDIDLDKLAKHFQTFESGFANLIQGQIQRQFVPGPASVPAPPRPWLIVDQLEQELEVARGNAHAFETQLAQYAGLHAQEQSEWRREREHALDDLRRRFEEERREIELAHHAEVDALHAKIAELEAV